MKSTLFLFSLLFCYQYLVFAGSQLLSTAEYKQALLEEDGLDHPEYETDKAIVRQTLEEGWRAMKAMKYKGSVREVKGIDCRMQKLKEVLEETQIIIDGRPAVIVVPFNAAWLGMAKHVDCSLKAVGIEKVFYWALDEAAESLGRKHGLVTYYDDRFKTTSTKKHAGLFTKAYLAMMRQRPRFWLDVLNSGHDIIFLDADIVVLKDVAKYVDDQIQLIKKRDRRPVSIDDDYSQVFGEYQTNEDGEMVYYVDGPAPDIIMQVDERQVIHNTTSFRWVDGCAGFFYMRASNGMKTIMRRLAYLLDDFSDMTASRQWTSKGWHWNDQTGLMHLLDKNALIRDVSGNLNDQENPLVRLEFFDQFDIANGHVMWNYLSRSELYKYKQVDEKYEEKYPVLVHANGQSKKKKAFKQLKLDFFKNWKKMTCKPFDKKGYLTQSKKDLDFFYRFFQKVRGKFQGWTKKLTKK